MKSCPKILKSGKVKSGAKILGDGGGMFIKEYWSWGTKGGRPPVYNNHLQYGRKCSSLDQTDNKWSATG